MARELDRLRRAARHAAAIGLECHAGHGLNYANVRPVAAIAEIVELNIGHFLVGEAVAIGLPEAMRRMRELMDAGRRDLARAREAGMKIAVLGAGGVGGYFGARLAAHGNDVTFIARGAHAAAMREQGLQVLSPRGRPAPAAGQAARGLAHDRAGRHRPGRGQDVRPRRRGGDHQAAARDRHRRGAVPERRRGAGHPRAGAGPALCLRRCRLHRGRDRGAGRDPAHRQGRPPGVRRAL